MSLTKLARKLRKNQTRPETLLWHRLRRKQLFGVKFRRQQPVGPFIPDFVSYEAHIIIEVDGGQHSELAIQDQQRDKWFANQGFAVLRFWNNQITHNMEDVVETIVNTLGKMGTEARISN